MKSTITNALLRRLANTISDGQPIWGLLWANEYIDELGPVYGALLKKARCKMEELGYGRCLTPNVGSLIQQTLQGVKLSSLEFNTRLVVQNLEQQKNQNTRKIISVVGRRTRRNEVRLPGHDVYPRLGRFRKSIGT